MRQPKMSAIDVIAMLLAGACVAWIVVSMFS
jgi:hypothetical protein